MKLLKIAALFAILAFKVGAHALDVNSNKVPSLDKGAYYVLSPGLAAAYGINYTLLFQALNVKNGQGLVIKKQEAGEGIDISIFDQEQFAQARQDFVMW